MEHCGCMVLGLKSFSRFLYIHYHSDGHTLASALRHNDLAIFKADEVVPMR